MAYAQLQKNALAKVTGLVPIATSVPRAGRQAIVTPQFALPDVTMVHVRPLGLATASHIGLVPSAIFAMKDGQIQIVIQVGISVLTYRSSISFIFSSYLQGRLSEWHLRRCPWYV